MSPMKRILPADSKVVGNTWLNVNSDGSPDRRYKHNMPCLICEFGKLRISSDTGLDVLFLLSNADNVEQFKSILPNKKTPANYKNGQGFLNTSGGIF